MGKLLLLLLTVAPLLVVLVTYGDKSRMAYLARGAAMGAISFFWLCLGVGLFMADGVEPIFTQVSREITVIVWLAVFGVALWAMVWNLKKASSEMIKQAVTIAKTPHVGPAPEPKPAPPPKPSPDPKQAEEKLKALLGD